MRSSWVSASLVVAVVSCSNKKEEPKAKPADRSKVVETEPAPKKPVPTAPLPELAADPGGATGKPIWQTAFGGLGIDAPRGVAVGPDGSVYVVGYFDGDIDFGGTIGKKPSAGGSDAFVAKLSPDGKLVWAQTWGSKRDDAANAVAVKGDKIVVVGNFLDTVKFGDFEKTSVGSDDAFVVELDTTGDVKWAWNMGGIDSDGANAVAAAPDGGWVIGGSFSDSIDIGSAHLKSNGRTDAFLAKLAASGDLEWVKAYGGRYDDTVMHVAVDANGNSYIQGHFKDTASFGGKPLKAAGGSDNDVVLAKYDTNGDHVWSQRFGNAFNDAAGGVAVDPAGHITMVGSFDKSISFGEGDDHTSLGEADAFIVRLTTDGKLEWAKTFGAEREDIAWGVASDASGNTVTTGWFQGSVDFGKGAVTSKGNKDVFALKLDPKGNTLWVQTWGDHDHDQGRGIALDDKGNVVVVGLFRFSLALMDPPLQSKVDDKDPVLSKAPKPDAFVVKLSR
jgi:hypothetical protein